MTTARAWRVDVHAHILCPSYLAEVDSRMQGRGRRTLHWSTAKTLERMDRWGIAAQVVSLADPGLRQVDPQRRGTVAHRCNAEMAELVGRFPARFGGLAALPLPDIDGSVDEVVHALDQLGLDGVAIASSEAGLYVGDPVMEPLLAALDRRSAWAMIHPGAIEGIPSDVLPPMAIEFPVDVTRAAVNLILRGAVHRYPNIRWFLAQAGATLPFFASRIAAFVAMSAPMKSEIGMPDSSLYMTPVDLFAAIGRFYFDTTLAGGSSAMRPILDIAPVEHVLYGSDLPFGQYVGGPHQPGADPSPELAAVFTPEQRRGMERDHALTHFPRLAAALAAPVAGQPTR